MVSPRHQTDLPKRLTAAACANKNMSIIIFDSNTINYFLSANKEGWLIVIYLSVIMQPIAYGVWYYVLGRNPVQKVMPVMLLLPVTSLFTAIYLLGEQPSKQLILGGTIILFGVGMILFNKKKRK